MATGFLSGIQRVSFNIQNQNNESLLIVNFGIITSRPVCFGKPGG